MSVSKCQCDAYYTESKEIIQSIESCITLDEPVFVVIECPICGQKRVIGGEPSIDFETGNPCIESFVFEYSEQYSGCPIHKSVLLEECSESESEFATWSRTKNRVINFKKRQN